MEYFVWIIKGSFRNLEQICGMLGTLKDLLCHEEGTTAIEYTFIVALISLAAVGGFTQFANELEGLYEHVESEFVGAQQQG